MLADIATVVGGQVISNEVGLNFEEVTLAMLGHAQLVTATKDTTTIVRGKGKKTDISARIAQLKTQAENTDSKFDKEKLEERIAKLSGGVAVISVGAATETEMKYLKDKIDDAVKATKASIEEGIVPGGGTALAKVAKKLVAHEGKMSADEKSGFDIVVHALEVPLAQIVINAGKDDAAVIVSKVQSGKANAGYDAMKDEIVDDMLASGIVDPAKMPRMALENAISAAALFLTTEAAIADIPNRRIRKRAVAREWEWTRSIRGVHVAGQAGGGGRAQAADLGPAAPVGPGPGRLRPPGGGDLGAGADPARLPAESNSSAPPPGSRAGACAAGRPGRPWAPSPPPGPPGPAQALLRGQLTSTSPGSRPWNCAPRQLAIERAPRPGAASSTPRNLGEDLARAMGRLGVRGGQRSASRTDARTIPAGHEQALHPRGGAPDPSTCWPGTASAASASCSWAGPGETRETVGSRAWVSPRSLGLDALKVTVGIRIYPCTPPGPPGRGGRARWPRTTTSYRHSFTWAPGFVPAGRNFYVLLPPPPEPPGLSEQFGAQAATLAGWLVFTQAATSDNTR